ncbi:MAG: Holliday junction resolvase RuvX [Candidatus Brocadiia bacterium]
MRVLGIDYGERRIGLALGDTEAPVATGLPTIQRAPSHGDPVEAIARVCREHQVDQVVVGLPLHMDGSRGDQARRAQAFAQRLRRALDADVVTWDERLTTRQADRAMLQADLSRARRKKRRDRLAAQLMLQSYLDAHTS